jgi:septal ring factor EnvC (AmiA/AmiB activator)
VSDDTTSSSSRESLAALVRQHESRLTRLEVKHEELEKQMQRRFDELTDTLRELKNEFAEYRRVSRLAQAEIADRVNTLTVRLAIVAAGSTAVVNGIAVFFTR